jgi:hypothetical protein
MTHIYHLLQAFFIVFCALAKLEKLYEGKKKTNMIDQTLLKRYQKTLDLSYLHTSYINYTLSTTTRSTYSTVCTVAIYMYHM